MTDWSTISSMATAGGTLVLAVATFSSVRSAGRSARVAERSLLANQRPILIPSREDDPPELIRFGDNVVLRVSGHGCAAEIHDGHVYMAIALRNGGSGLAVIHGWHLRFLSGSASGDPPPDPASIRRQQRDLYIPAGSPGFWQGAVRDAADPELEPLRRSISRQERVLVDLLYSDHEGGQRAIARFGLSSSLDSPDDEAGLVRAEVLRFWNVDREDPR